MLKYLWNSPNHCHLEKTQITFKSVTQVYVLPGHLDGFTDAIQLCKNLQLLAYTLEMISCYYCINHSQISKTCLILGCNIMLHICCQYGWYWLFLFILDGIKIWESEAICSLKPSNVHIDFCMHVCMNEYMYDGQWTILQAQRTSKHSHRKLLSPV